MNVSLFTHKEAQELSDKYLALLKQHNTLLEEQATLVKKHTALLEEHSQVRVKLARKEGFLEFIVGLLGGLCNQYDNMESPPTINVIQ